MIMQISLLKKLSLALVAAAALTLSACADPDSATTQDDVDPVADPQTEIEQEATGVSDVEQVTEGVDSAEVEGSLVVDPVVAEDDAAIITTDEVLDGTESEEHVSTY